MKRADFLRAKFFIFADVEREIQLAKTNRNTLGPLGINPGGGNFLAALGLFCYTEFGGWLRFGYKNGKGQDISSKNFNDFFEWVGADYAKFRGAHDVYKVFRCGLAHEYYVKKTCINYMVAKRGRPDIWQTSGGRYKISVEAYCRDLKVAF